MGEAIAGTIRDKFPGTTIVFFSHEKEQTFGSIRFPPGEEYKDGDTVEETLGAFVTQLPPRARK